MSSDDHSEANGSAKASAVLRLFGTSWGPCGYCKGTRSHLSAQPASRTKQKQGDEINCCCSYAVYSHQMEPSFYEHMICNGWRRSGNVIYLPNNKRSCCPTYPIRLLVNSFEPSKSQRKVLKRVNNLAVIPSVVTDSENPILNDFSTDGACREEMQTSRMTRRKLEHPVSDKGDIKDDIPSGERASIQEVVMQSKSLKLLCQWTNNALLDVLRRILVDSNMIQTIEQGLPSVHYKVKPTKSPSQHQKENVTCVSTICAAVAGKSRGGLRRGDLVQRVVDELRKCLSKHHKQASASLDDESDDFDTGVVIEAIDCHSESGQILASFIVDTSKLNVAFRSMLASSKLALNTLPSEDRIQKWWKSLSGNGMYPGDFRSNHQQPRPPYEFTITTLPAHESALNPQVHQLYWQYQHVVHGETDPRIVDNTCFQKQSININLSSASNGENDVDPALDDGLNGHETSSESDNASVCDLGNHAPKGWREAAIRMLNQEYRQCPQSHQRQLIAAYTSFYEFLVENPFLNASRSPPVQRSKHEFPLVTYHQHYVLSGGTLVAVGVIDVLPSGLSSVYLFYDPSFADYIVPMGKYSTLKEIEYTRQFVQEPYYYLGYYIHSCPKMSYKSEYKPSEVLCPISKQWVGADHAKSIIEKDSPGHNYCSLVPTNDSLENTVNHDPSKDDIYARKQINQIALELGFGKPILFGTLNARDQNMVRPALQEFIDIIGVDAASKCIIDLHEK